VLRKNIAFQASTTLTQLFSQIKRQMALNLQHPTPNGKFCRGAKRRARQKSGVSAKASQRWLPSSAALAGSTADRFDCSGSTSQARQAASMFIGMLSTCVLGVVAAQHTVLHTACALTIIIARPELRVWPIWAKGCITMLCNILETPFGNT